MAEYAGEWLDSRPELAPSTIQGYRDLLDTWVLLRQDLD